MICQCNIPIVDCLIEKTSWPIFITPPAPSFFLNISKLRVFILVNYDQYCTGITNERAGHQQTLPAAQLVSAGSAFMTQPLNLGVHHHRQLQPPKLQPKVLLGPSWTRSDVFFLIGGNRRGGKSWCWNWINVCCQASKVFTSVKFEYLLPCSTNSFSVKWIWKTPMHRIHMYCIYTYIFFCTYMYLYKFIRTY